VFGGVDARPVGFESTRIQRGPCPSLFSFQTHSPSRVMRLTTSLSLPSPRLLGWITILGLWFGMFGPTTYAQSGGEPAAVVGMTNSLNFSPDTVRVQVGETVRWENSSIIVHTVTADPEEATKDQSVQLPEKASPFDSGPLDPDATFEHTFTVPGTYRYFCVPHEGTKMYGTVIVNPTD